MGIFERLVAKVKVFFNGVEMGETKTIEIAKAVAKPVMPNNGKSTLTLLDYFAKLERDEIKRSRLIDLSYRKYKSQRRRV